MELVRHLNHCITIAIWLLHSKILTDAAKFQAEVLLRWSALLKMPARPSRVVSKFLFVVLPYMLQACLGVLSRQETQCLLRGNQSNSMTKDLKD